jgi:hypothetical protein
MGHGSAGAEAVVGARAPGEELHWAVWALRIGAVANILFTLPAFIAYHWYVGQVVSSPPDYPFLVWIWSGMGLMFGFMFWEISRDILGKASMIKYAWLEKAITAGSVIVAGATGNVPAKFVVGVVFTDLIWVPIFIAVDVRARGVLRERGLEPMAAPASAGSG